MHASSDPNAWAHLAISVKARGRDLVAALGPRAMSKDDLQQKRKKRKKSPPSPPCPLGRSLFKVLHRGFACLIKRERPLELYTSSVSSVSSSS